MSKLDGNTVHASLLIFPELLKLITKLNNLF